MQMAFSALAMPAKLGTAYWSRTSIMFSKNVKATPQSMILRRAVSGELGREEGWLYSHWRRLLASVVGVTC
jgi:hypothetical protein